MRTRHELAEACRSGVGRFCYVWGGNGEDMTAMTEAARNKWIDRREKEQKNRDRVRKLFDRLAAEGVTPIRGADCSGFLFYEGKTLGLWNDDRKAEGFRRECIPVETPEEGDLGFRLDDKGRATHVGIFDGEMWIHCKGRDEGVVREKCGWACYGRLPQLTGAEDPEPGIKHVIIKGSVRVRQQPSKNGKELFTAHRGDRFVYLGESSPDERGCLWYAIESDHPEAEHGIAYVSAFTLDRKKYTEVL